MTFFDERFMTHRLRATSIAGVTGGSLAMIFWCYHFIADHHFNAELFSIGVSMAVIKQGLMAWYRWRD